MHARLLRLQPLLLQLLRSQLLLHLEGRVLPSHATACCSLSSLVPLPRSHVAQAANVLLDADGNAKVADFGKLRVGLSLR
jgi:hypothetical protein